MVVAVAVDADSLTGKGTARVRSPWPDWSPARPFCTRIVARTFLSPKFCKIENGGGVGMKNGQDEVLEDAHQAPSLQTPEAENPGLAGVWCRVLDGYSRAVLRQG